MNIHSIINRLDNSYRALTGQPFVEHTKFGDILLAGKNTRQVKQLLANTINNQLFPRMIQHGFPLKGYHFAWDDTVDYTPEQQLAFETMIADRYEVDPKYFADKYNMPVGNRLQTGFAFGGNDDDDGSKDSKDSKDDKQQANAFFD